MYNKSALVLLLFSAFIVYESQSAVIGIDIGAEYYKISVIAPGKALEIVENLASKRKTPTAVSFYDSTRYFEEAPTKRSRYPLFTFTNINKYVALPYNKTLLETYKAKELDYYNTLVSERGEILFHVGEFQSDSKDEAVSLILTVEEIYSHIFNYAKTISEKFVNGTIKDCVITIPPYFSVQQRESIVFAAQVAGLNSLALINENSGAAIHYGLERQDENATHRVMYYNLGSNDLTVSIVEYSATKLKGNKTVETISVLCDAWDQNLGGQDIDFLIVDHAVELIDKLSQRKGKPSIREEPRAMHKLLREATKTKETLSANKEVTLYVDGLTDDINFKTVISRSIIEGLLSKQADKFIRPVHKALSVCNLTLSDINIIELLGGGIRVPYIQSLLNDRLKGAEIGAHLNGDEAMAFGAAFYGANSSVNFKVRQIIFEDGFNDIIYISVANVDSALDGTEYAYNKTGVLFKQKHKVDVKKSITIKYDQDIKISVFTNSTEPGTRPYERKYETSNLREIVTSDKNQQYSNPEISIDFFLNTYGVPELKGIDLIFIETIEIPNSSFKSSAKIKKPVEVSETKDEPKKVEDSKEKEDSSEKDSETNDEATNEDKDDKMQEEENKKEEDENDSNDEPGSSDDDDDDDEAKDDNETKDGDDDEEAKGEEEGETKEESEKSEQVKVEEMQLDQNATNKKTKNITHKNTVKFSKIGLHSVLEDKKFKNDAEKKLKMFIDFEEKKRKLSEAKNKLESLIYEVKDYLENDMFTRSSTSEERELLTKLVTENGNWLEDEGYAAPIEDFNKKYTQLNNRARTVIHRMEQNRDLPAYVERFFGGLKNITNQVHKLNESKPWIGDEKVNEVLKKINDVHIEITSTWSKQKKLDLTEDPLITTGEIKKKYDNLREEYNKLKNTPKPKNSTNTTSSAPPKSNNTTKDTKSNTTKKDTKSNSNSNTNKDGKGKFDFQGKKYADSDLDKLMKEYLEKKRREEEEALKNKKEDVETDDVPPKEDASQDSQEKGSEDRYEEKEDSSENKNRGEL